MKITAIKSYAVKVGIRNQLLVKIETAGLCHTDIHAAHGDWPVKPSLPFIPGHEGVGIVEQVGPGVTSPRVGDRVAMPWLGSACGTCEFCVDGWETLSRLRADPRTAGLPVVLCTVKGLPEDTFKGWSLGCDGYLGKPFDIGGLVDELQAVLRRTPEQRQAIRRDKIAELARAVRS